MAEVRPVVINEHNVILGGNMRFKAMVEAGWNDIPVTKVKGWTKEQEQEFIIKDNVSGGEWDWDQLANGWDVQDLDEWGLDVPDFAGDVEVEEDEAPDVSQEPPVSKLGEVYQLGRHRIMCADSTVKENVELLMNGEKADVVFTDPPYGFNYTKKSDGLSIQNDGDEFVDVIRDAISLIQCDTYFICGDAKTARKFFIATEHLGEPKSTIVWVKPIQHRMHRFEPCHELIWYWGDNGNPFYGSNVFQAKREINKTHPTIKPIELIELAFLITVKSSKAILPTDLS